jgi:hypothetical protein
MAEAISKITILRIPKLLKILQPPGTDRGSKCTRKLKCRRAIQLFGYKPVSLERSGRSPAKEAGIGEHPDRKARSMRRVFSFNLKTL